MRLLKIADSLRTTNRPPRPLRLCASAWEINQ